MTKKLSWDEALQRLLRGEVVAARDMKMGAPAYLRRQAIRLGYRLEDSGIFEYRTYSFTKTA